MRRFVVSCSAVVVLLACSKSDTPAADTSKPAAPAPPPAAAPISLAQVAGKWNLTSTPQGGADTTSTKAVLMATADTTGWTLTLPNRPPMPLHVSVSGDSIMMDASNFQSVRRKGMTVTLLHSVSRMQDGKLVGTTAAHYKTTQPDSVVMLRTEAVKAP